MGLPPVRILRGKSAKPLLSFNLTTYVSRADRKGHFLAYLQA